MAIIGSFSRPLIRAIGRRSYTLLGVICASLLVGLIIFAATDLFSFAKLRDQRAHKAVVEGELARFLLATRDDGGGNLLESPDQFARAEKALSVMTLKRPFFTYFLKRANASGFDVNEVTWQAPSQCTLEFSNHGSFDGAGTLQACFARIENDPLGNYVYFSLRIPMQEPLVRHERGRALSRADTVHMTFQGDKTVSVVLAYETPPLALQRYPSRLSQFTRVHELAGFQQDGQVQRWIGGQAVEREEVVAGQIRRHVQLLGRIDSAALLHSKPDGGFDLDRLPFIKIGLATFANYHARPNFNIPIGGLGSALLSLEQAYLQQVQSKSRLEVVSTRSPHRHVWSSDRVSSLRGPERHDWFQAISDRWSNRLIRLLVDDAEPFRAQQRVPGVEGFDVSLTQMPPQIPELAARMILVFSAAILVVILFFYVYFKAILRLGTLANAAYELAARPTRGRLTGFKMNNTELGIFARVLELSIRKSRLRGLKAVYLSEFGFRVKNAQLKSRHAVLEALGHEIREPLQSLILKAEKEGSVPPQLLKMERAINTLYTATDLINAVDRRAAVLSSENIGDLLLDYCSGQFKDDIRLVPPNEEAVAMVDTFWLEPVLDNLLTNAKRHKTPGSKVEVKALKKTRSVQIEVSNEGSLIPEDRLDAIFEYGDSSRDTTQQRGIGLFMVRLYMLAMSGSVKAENRENGVAMILELPTPMDVSNIKFSDKAPRTSSPSEGAAVV